MSSEYSNTSGRRPRRGGRRSGGRNFSGPRPARQESAAPAKPQKQTLWQKIMSFFSGEEAPKPSAPRSTGSASTTSRAPSENRNRFEDRPEKPARPTGFRKPEIIEVTSPRVYVGNLSFDAAESDLFELFNGVGTVENVEVVSNKHTMKSKGFAFVQMTSVDEAKRAVAELHDKEYMGRKLVVSGAKAVEEKRSERVRQPEQQPEAQPQSESQPEQ